MRLAYMPPVKPEAKVAFEGDPSPIKLTEAAVRAEVGWRVRDGHLTGITLALPGQLVRTAEPITPGEGTKEIAFRLAAHVANSVCRHTDIDAIDPAAVLLNSPHLLPETEDEVSLLASKKRSRVVGATVSVRIVGGLDPAKISWNVKNTAALALYADATRAADPFVRFELFYRVLEYFFPHPQNQAPGHLRGWPAFSGESIHEVRARVQQWDRLRHRSVHPIPRREAELRRDDLNAIREVRSEEGPYAGSGLGAARQPTAVSPRCSLDWPPASRRARRFVSTVALTLPECFERLRIAPALRPGRAPGLAGRTLHQAPSGPLAARLARKLATLRVLGPGRLPLASGQTAPALRYSASIAALQMLARDAQRVLVERQEMRQQCGVADLAAGERAAARDVRELVGSSACAGGRCSSHSWRRSSACGSGKDTTTSIRRLNAGSMFSPALVVTTAMPSYCSSRCRR